jgi:hypothetical protein
MGAVRREAGWAVTNPQLVQPSNSRPGGATALYGSKLVP